MPAALIFRFARTRRCWIVGSVAMNARAISRVESPPTVRSVNATRESIGSAGWQHVKINRSRSSVISCISSSASRSWMRWTSSVFSRRRCSRRRRSIARLRAVVVIHAPGLSGTPSTGQRSSAIANASCTASSASSKSPSTRMSVATARPGLAAEQAIDDVRCLGHMSMSGLTSTVPYLTAGSLPAASIASSRFAHSMM